MIGKEFGEAWGAQGGKHERVCHMVSKLNLVFKELEDGRKGSAWVPHHKMEMAMVKVENIISKEVHEAKKLAKQVVAVS